MKNEPNEAGAKRQRYDGVFKQEALRLWAERGGAAKDVAQELGIQEGDLYRWRRAKTAPRAAGAASSPVGEAALHAEVVRLQAEVARLTEQRDILKKAAGILCEPPPRGMPGSKP
jgi:transposase